MKKKQYLRIDVDVYRKILQKKFNLYEDKEASKTELLKIIQQIHKIEIKINGINEKNKNKVKMINYKEYGYRDNDDAFKDVYSEIFEDKIIITLYPLGVYELDDNIDLPKPKNEIRKQFIAIIADTYERIKVKVDNIIEECEDEKNIELYAKKNIQKAYQIYNKSIQLLKRHRRKKDTIESFYVLVQSIFIMHTILYMQKVFSTFYNNKYYSKESLNSELFESVGMENVLQEPIAEYTNKEIKDNNNENVEKARWNGNSNKLLTLIFDLKNTLNNDNQPLFDISLGLVKKIFNEYILDKNGKPISENTIRICLQEYREDKRAKGKNRISITKYSEMD